MTATNGLDDAFRSALRLSDDVDLDDAAYGRTEGWDSVGHMELMLALEAAFGIAIDADDVFEMSDYRAVREILRRSYGVELRDGRS